MASQLEGIAQQDDRAGEQGGACEKEGIAPGWPRRVAIGASCVVGRRGGEHVGENNGGMCTCGYAYPVLCDTMYITHDGFY